MIVSRLVGVHELSVTNADNSSGDPHCVGWLSIPLTKKTRLSGPVHVPLLTPKTLMPLSYFYVAMWGLVFPVEVYCRARDHHTTHVLHTTTEEYHDNIP